MRVTRDENLTSVLVVALAAWAAVRLALGLWGRAAMWPFDAPAWLDGAARWAPWVACAALLVPAVGRRAGGLFAASLSNAVGRLALVALVLVVLATLPDRLWLLGDFWLRQTNLGMSLAEMQRIVPQAMPLDLLWHHLTARALAGAFHGDANLAGRMLGLADGVLGGVTAFALARELGRSAAARASAWAVLMASGALQYWTGYDKAQAEMAPAWWLVCWLGLRLLRIGRGQVALAITLVLAVGFHRVALALLPAVAFALAASPATADAGPAAKRRLAGFAVTAAGLLALAPWLLRAFTQVDASPAGYAAASALRGGANHLGRHVVDVVGQAFAYIPVLPVACAGLLGRPAGTPSRSVRLLLLATLPILVLGMGFGGGLGPLRDSDPFASLGAALAVLAAWGGARLVDTLDDGRHVTALVFAISAAGSVQPMMLVSSTLRGLERIEAYVQLPRPPAPEERARLYAFLGTRRLELGQPAEAADAFAASAALAPAPTLMRQWALAEWAAGREDRARDVYRTLLDREPDDPFAWNDWGRFCASTGDTSGMRIARERLVAIRARADSTRATSSPR
jgi:tetratricopeptide (TPR) repeat protein